MSGPSVTVATRRWTTRETLRRATVIKAILMSELGDKLRASEPLARHTSFHVGGPAEWFFRADSAADLGRAVAVARRLGLPVRVLGGGSNVLVSDAGIRGLVILNRSRGYTLAEAPDASLTLVAESGAALPFLAGQLAREGAAGLEWAVGVPGTVGGAVVQNAGAWGHEIKDSLLWIEVQDPRQSEVSAEAAHQRLPAAALDLRYRHSALRDLPPAERPTIVRAAFRLARDEPAASQARLAAFVTRRTASQPRAASGGSTFTNPPGDHAGRLIEAAALKGRRIGGAEISRQHANFIVTDAGATASDIQALIELARHEVARQFGVWLEPEIELLGEWEADARLPHEHD
ncbi:MAG: UDP-N-acetylmuramate dehydrogenase [Ardenticatenaceae bacterium]|nr:UDP-N-acetylmuramate dehydrogenase [Ardenticatenaceae bacterium]